MVCIKVVLDRTFENGDATNSKFSGNDIWVSTTKVRLLRKENG